MALESKIKNVSIVVKANVYFEGKVVSHTVELSDGSKKTLGFIYPGSFCFDTTTTERMDIVAGSCRVRLNGHDDYKSFSAGGTFEVPAHQSFDITVENGVVEYVCSYL
ncbi:MAG: pyrimidine/purine nucleoside phosphorylase [Endomicrobiales bacterium]|jgi:uncharacterized protein YaiE (UPF0345 family)